MKYVVIRGVSRILWGACLCRKNINPFVGNVNYCVFNMWARVCSAWWMIVTRSRLQGSTLFRSFETREGRRRVIVVSFDYKTITIRSIIGNSPASLFNRKVRPIGRPYSWVHWSFETQEGRRRVIVVSFNYKTITIRSIIGNSPASLFNRKVRPIGRPYSWVHWALTS